MDPRIRIRIYTKMSWIRNTAFNYDVLHRRLDADSDKIPESRPYTYILNLSVQNNDAVSDHNTWLSSCCWWWWWMTCDACPCPGGRSGGWRRAVRRGWLARNHGRSCGCCSPSCQYTVWFWKILMSKMSAIGLGWELRRSYLQQYRLLLLKTWGELWGTVSKEYLVSSYGNDTEVVLYALKYTDTFVTW